tara:strand:- start:532 stop:1197 length:666 start_codon:yes stop_codon:yes gene_type:complete
MFKKRCPRCERKVEKNYDFCPYCGRNLKSKHENEDYGFLGKNDFINEDTNSMLNMGGSFMDKMINNAMKMIEKQMKESPEGFEENIKKIQSKLPPNMSPNMKIRFMVNGKEIPINQINKNQEQPIKKISPKISEHQSKKLAKLPRKEPKTKMKRLAKKLIYELEVPGVDNIQDIIINKLENSIEIKALSKDKIYSKTININLPILRYSLNNGNLILELQAK